MSSYLQEGRWPTSRRRFVTGAVSLGALGALSISSAGAQELNPPAELPVLRGTHFELEVGYLPVNITGHKSIATVVNGSMPAPTLIWKEGEDITIRVTNRLAVDTSIHWHGIILPSAMDGVPGLSFDGIKPGETFEYRFRVQQSGTYWYHSHSGHQEQTGLFGAIIIEPKTGAQDRYDREHVVMLSDWSDEDPHRVYQKLKKMPHYYNTRERTLNDLYEEIRQKGVKATWNERAMWNQMRMSDRDISDVTGMTYTFLVNGQTPDTGWVGMFRAGERVKLRIINASAMTLFDVHIPGLKMTVVASDGQALEPVTVDEFRIAVAETYDVIVEPESDTAYTFFAQAIDRSGYARGTLTPHPSLRAPVPDMDPAPILSHMDMGMSHGTDHSGHAADASVPSTGVHDHASMGHAGMDHGSMGMMGHKMGMQGDHTMHGMMQAHRSPPDAVMGSGRAGFGSAADIVHAQSEYSPRVDMRVQMPTYRLDDPGIGLRDHKRLYGRRVLTYADLKNRIETLDPREPEREIQLHLTGNMSRYMWSFNGIPFAHAEPLRLTLGERVRITLVNDTMMNHPIHLHGLWSELETGDAKYIPRKHTILVQPGSKISYLVTADSRGRWAYHCHLLHHMMEMFREVVVG